MVLTIGIRARTGKAPKTKRRPRDFSPGATLRWFEHASRGAALSTWFSVCLLRDARRDPTWPPQRYSSLSRLL